MSNSKYFKEHGPSWLNTSLLDIISNIDDTKTKKYIPIIVNFFSERLDKISNDIREDGERFYIFEEVSHWVGKEKANNLSIADMIVYYRFLENMDKGFFSSLKKFIEFNEKGMFKGLDTTKIATIKEINQYVSQAELKDAEKFYSKQVVKIFENETWLIIRPISRESSLKYGATTKWCTASVNSPHQFFEYTHHGSLYYVINKDQNYKFAFYKNFDTNDVSFWNEQDDRIDSIVLNLDNDVRLFISNELRENNLTNRELDIEIWEKSKVSSITEYEKESEVEEIRFIPQGRPVIEM